MCLYQTFSFVKLINRRNQQLHDEWTRAKSFESESCCATTTYRLVKFLFYFYWYYHVRVYVKTRACRSLWPMPWDLHKYVTLFGQSSAIALIFVVVHKLVLILNNCKLIFHDSSLYFSYIIFPILLTVCFIDTVLWYINFLCFLCAFIFFKWIIIYYIERTNIMNPTLY